MKIPEMPPSINDLTKSLSAEQIGEVILRGQKFSVQSKDYLHWDDLAHRTPPQGLVREQWWLLLKLGRTPRMKDIPLLDKGRVPFKFGIEDTLSEQLHLLDLSAGGRIGISQTVANPDTKNEYFMSSLMEEAVTSSLLEGAATTRKAAKEMLRTARKPRTHGERMVANNFAAMQRIGDLKNEALTPDMIFELHRIVTDRTLDDPTAAGRFRRKDEKIVIEDRTDGITIHIPPDAGELAERVEAMCAFANKKTPDTFVHPAIRAIILHFWLAYDHPFVDGNGRTARALFYWAMLHYGFWLCEYLSISRLLLKAPVKYARSFLLTETDENDLTYFVLFQMQVIQQAIAALDEYLTRKTAEVKSAEMKLQNSRLFNHRQQALITHALRHPQFRYTIAGHQRSHNVSYPSAREDLLQLAAQGLFHTIKSGRAFVFMPVPDFEAKLKGR